MTAPARLSAPARAPLGLKGESYGKGRGRDRGIRYRMLGLAQRLMYAPGRPAELQALITRCQWRRIGGEVKVRRNQESNRMSYHGLESCNNVWSCPVCSERITNGRREELQRAVTNWKERGGECYLVTATFPHQRTDNLDRLIELMRKTARYFNDSKAVQRVREAAGYVGQVRAFEVTWGSWHGWHPHFHFLYFCQPGQLAVLRALDAAWANALIRSGLADRAKLNDMLHGADGEAVAWDVQKGDYAADYIVKFGREPSLESAIGAHATWGIAREMVKGMSKTGRRLRGLTPFTLLAAAAREIVLVGMKPGRAAALFCEFAVAFKGERMLYWSPKLRAVLDMGRLFTDAELAELEDRKPKYETVCTLTREDWALVLAHEARDAVLRAAEQNGAQGVAAVLDRLRAAGPPPRSERIGHELPDGQRALGLDSPRFGLGA